MYNKTVTAEPMVVLTCNTQYKVFNYYNGGGYEMLYNKRELENIRRRKGTL